MSEKESPPRSPAKLKVLIKKPETTEDLVVLALERGGLDEVVQLLRDWCGSKEIRKCLNKLNYRDPVDRFTHMRRLSCPLISAPRISRYSTSMWRYWDGKEAIFR